MNRFVPEMDTSMKKSDEERQKEAYTRTYTDEDGDYVIPRKAIKAVIVAGGAKVSVGRAKAKGLLKAVLYLEGDAKLTHSGDILIRDDVKIPPRTGARVIKYWVAFKEWSAEFDIVITDDAMKPEAISNSIIAGGIYNGLLDGRPDYGRYVLDEMKIVK